MILSERLSQYSNVEILRGDVLSIDVPEFNKIVSTPPYDISSRLLLWVLKKHFDCTVLVLQKEFANRLVAPVGSECYGWITVVTYYHVEVELLDDVPKSLFYPSPKVDSVITRLIPKEAPLKLEIGDTGFKRLVQTLFTQRNRKVRNAVLPCVRGTRRMTKDTIEVVVEKLPFLDRRVRELSPEDFGVLANALKE